MSMTIDELRSEVNRLIDEGNQEMLERFVLDHFKEFPEDMQGQILIAFLTETLDKQTGEAEVSDLQKKGIDAIKEIMSIKTQVSEASAENV